MPLLLDPRLREDDTTAFDIFPKKHRVQSGLHVVSLLREQEHT